MLEKAEILEMMKSTWRIFKNYCKYGTCFENITDEGACTGVMCISDVYKDYQKLKQQLKKAPGNVTCPQCGRTISPITDKCPECDVVFTGLWNAEWDSQEKQQSREIEKYPVLTLK